MRATNMTNSRGNKMPNQFIIEDDTFRYFQSYKTTIVRQSKLEDNSQVLLDRKTWNYSVTTARYRNLFLDETTKETQAKIDSGEYLLADLND